MVRNKNVDQEMLEATIRNCGSMNELVEKLKVSRSTVCNWLRRFKLNAVAKKQFKANRCRKISGKELLDASKERECPEIGRCGPSCSPKAKISKIKSWDRRPLGKTPYGIDFEELDEQAKNDLLKRAGEVPSKSIAELGQDINRACDTERRGRLVDTLITLTNLLIQEYYLVGPKK